MKKDTHTYIIKNRKPFCLWMNKEVGIATRGYFASTKYVETEANEYIKQVSGGKFGWIDHNGHQYVTSKYDINRPTDQQIHDTLESHSKFAQACVKKGLIEPSGIVSIKAPLFGNVWLN